MVNFASLVNWLTFADVFHQGDNFYQKLYTFLMILKQSETKSKGHQEFPPKHWQFKGPFQELPEGNSGK